MCEKSKESGKTGRVKRYRAKIRFEKRSFMELSEWVRWSGSGRVARPVKFMGDVDRMGCWGEGEWEDVRR